MSTTVYEWSFLNKEKSGKSLLHQKVFTTEVIGLLLVASLIVPSILIADWSSWWPVRENTKALDSAVVDAYYGRPKLNADERSVKVVKLSEGKLVTMETHADRRQRIRLQFQIAGDVSRHPTTFRYKTIDYDHEIRVLKIYPGQPSDDLQCRLLPCALKGERHHSQPKDSQPYTALSYYWGQDTANNKVYMFDDDEPQAVFARLRQEDLRANMRNRIAFMYIQQNLNKALRQLRLQDKPVYVWSDALCINQEDMVEKTAQVSNMHEVYMQAEDVCVWLGDAEGREEENSKTFTFLQKVLDLQELETHVRDLQKQDQRAREEHEGVIRLMQSEYFKRRWIIQELALAREAEIRCGDSTMSWLDFADSVALYLTKHDDIKRAYERPDTYGASSDDEYNRNDLLDARALGANKLVAATSNLFRRSKEGTIQQRLLSLEQLVSCWLLDFQATDPKDTIFAVLQIAKDTSGIAMTTEKTPTKTLSLTSSMFQFIIFPAALFISFAFDPRHFRSDSLAVLTKVEDTWSMKVFLANTQFVEFVRQTTPWLIRMVLLLTICQLSLLISDLFNKKIIAPFRNSDRSGAFERVDSRLEPKYGKPIVDVYGGFLEYCIETSNSLDVLCRHWAPNSMEAIVSGEVSMPSWILPISGHAFGSTGKKRLLPTRKNADSLVGGLEPRRSYNASGFLRPSYKFGKNRVVPQTPGGLSLERPVYAEKEQLRVRLPPRFDGTLALKGFNLGIIDRSAAILSGIISQAALEILGWSTEIPEPSNIDQVWRTLVANRGPGGTTPPNWYRRACLESLQWSTRRRHEDFNTEKLKKLKDTPSAIIEFLERVQQVVWGRQCFSCPVKGKANLFGLAPRETQTSDLICVLFGCSVPVVLRRVEGNFKFIGECYVHGMMDGEAVDPIPKHSKVQWFNIN